MKDFQVKATVCAGESARISKVMTKKLESGLESTYVLQNVEITEEGHPLQGEIVPATRTLLNAENAELKANNEEHVVKQPLEEGTEITLYARIDNGNIYFDAQGQELESLEDRSARLPASIVTGKQHAPHC